MCLAKLHGVTSQKTLILMASSVQAENNTNGTICTHSPLHWVRLRHFLQEPWYGLCVGITDFCGGGNVRNEVVLVHSMKTYEGVEVWLHSFFTSAPNLGSGQPYTPTDLPRNRSPSPIEQRTGWQPHSRSGRGGENRNIVPFPGIKPQFFRRIGSANCTTDVIFTHVSPCNSMLITVRYKAASFSCTLWSAETQTADSFCYCAGIVIWCEVLTCCMLTEQPAWLMGVIE